jgi:hypothetical protein
MLIDIQFIVPRHSSPGNGSQGSTHKAAQVVDRRCSSMRVIRLWTIVCVACMECHAPYKLKFRKGRMCFIVSTEEYTVKLVLRGHLWDIEKVAL